MTGNVILEERAARPGAARGQVDRRRVGGLSPGAVRVGGCVRYSTGVGVLPVAL